MGMTNTATAPGEGELLPPGAGQDTLLRAVGEEISRVFKAAGDTRLGIEGYDNNSCWLLLDYGDIVVHVQDAAARELYDLEGLWADAPRVEWSADATTPAGPASGDNGPE